jgi:hypothetical protein
MSVEPIPPRSRIFPPVTGGLYSDLPGETATGLAERIAASLLALAGRKLGRAQRLLGWKLDGAGRIGCLLTLHWAAMEAEADAVWDRADFFWKELRNEIAALWERVSLWEEAVATVTQETDPAFNQGAIDAIKLRDQLLDEIFLDTHHAFYLGLTAEVESLSPNDRAFAHVEAIEQLLDCSARTREEQRAVFGPLLEARIAAYREAGRWEEAITSAKRLTARFSGDKEYEDLLILIEHLRATSSLRNSDIESTNLSDAETLRRGIERIEELRRTYPNHPACFQSLAVLHHLRAVKLVNGNRLSQALLAVEKSLAFQPGEEVAEKTRRQLVEMMHGLQRQMRAVEAELASRANATLNAEGQRLRDEARLGFQQADSYRASIEAGEIARALAVAQARTFWQKAGLPVPASGWDKSAFALGKAIEQIVSNPPKRASRLLEVWQRRAAAEPALAEVDPEPVLAFLRRHLFEEEEEAAPVFPEPSPLAVRSRERRRGGEPFLEWLFSRQNLWIKAQAAVAVVLLLVAGVLTIRDAYNRQVRDSAWSGLQEASRDQDDLGIIRASEEFFSTSPPPGGDALRQDQARSLYSTALVRWFVRLPGEPDGEALRHVERYRSFLATYPGEARP